MVCCQLDEAIEGERGESSHWYLAVEAYHQADLAEHFIESWTYTACMDIVQNCDEWSRIDRPNGDYSGLVAYESARSELLDIARVQVSRLSWVERRMLT
jgi:hypothetical protein